MHDTTFEGADAMSEETFANKIYLRSANHADMLPTIKQIWWEWFIFP